MLAAVLLVAFPLALVAQDAPAIAEGRALTIGLIGAGNMGGPLGQLLAAAGHQVVYSSRNPAELLPLVESASPRATAAYADVGAPF
jgi:phosphoglycerate dehydrogenase-like enzyme